MLVNSNFSLSHNVFIGSWTGDCEFDTRFRQTLFPAYFCLSPLKYVREVLSGFGKKVVLNPNTINILTMF